jgi:hypothetical protein
VGLIGAEHEHMSVGLRPRHRVRPDDARSARTVVDDDRLVEFGRGLLRDQARGRIDRPARRVGHDDGDGAAGEGLAAGRRRQGERNAGESGAAAEHLGSNR